MSVGARIGYATRTSDEPPVTGLAGFGEANRTVWYSWRPVAAGLVVIDWGSEDFSGSKLSFGAISVYDDAGTGALTELPKETAEGGAGLEFQRRPGTPLPHRRRLRCPGRVLADVGSCHPCWLTPALIHRRLSGAPG